MTNNDSQFRKETVFICLLGTYLSVGLYFCFVIAGLHSSGTSTQFLLGFLYFTLLWPLVIGMYIVGFLAAPILLCLVVVAALALNNRFLIALSLFLTLLVLVLSLFHSVPISKTGERSEVKLGLPIAFVLQDQSVYSPLLPAQSRLYSAHNNPTQLLIPQFLISFSLVYAMTSVFLNRFKRLFESSIKKLHSEPKGF